jgi:SAM-dependent methyltransferase
VKNSTANRDAKELAEKQHESFRRWNAIEPYSRWMHNSYKRYIGKRVLEVGVGLGRNVQFYIQDTEISIGLDIRENSLETVKALYAGYPFETVKCNLETDDVSFLKEYNIDTVLCVNVLEHIADDAKALRNMKEIVSEGGRIVILVPAHSKLYSFMDKNVGHHRRYDKGQLRAMANEIGLKVAYNRYFNLFGIIPVALKKKFGKPNNRNLSQNLINPVSSKLFNLAAFIMEPIEKLIKVPTGLSEIIVLEKHG